MFSDGQAQSGTTATVCLLRNSVELVVGHVGDSRALLCRNGLAQKLTVDHTAELFSEKVVKSEILEKLIIKFVIMYKYVQTTLIKGTNQ